MAVIIITIKIKMMMIRLIPTLQLVNAVDLIWLV